MMNSSSKIALLVCGVLLSVAAVAGIKWLQPWDAGQFSDFQKQLSGTIPQPQENLNAFEARLKEAQTHYGRFGSTRNADLYNRALIQIDDARKLIALNGQSVDAREAFERAFFLTQGALIQLATVEAQAKNTNLKIDLDNIFQRMDMAKDSLDSLRAMGVQLSGLHQPRYDGAAENSALRDAAVRQLKELTSDNITLRESPRGLVLSASDLLFTVGSSELTGEFEESLKRVAAILTAFDGARVVVEGHSDNSGEKMRNVELSQERAARVRNFLINAGVNAQRIESRGFGPDQPVAPNATEAGRKKNRRVDLIVTSLSN
jgi:outer membrane protein OmpA-like peptidoglycan-associated protein